MASKETNSEREDWREIKRNPKGGWTVDEGTKEVDYPKIDSGKDEWTEIREKKFAKGGMVKANPVATIGVTRSSRHYPKGKR